jgi:hypothetical protein
MYPMYCIPHAVHWDKSICTISYIMKLQVSLLDLLFIALDLIANLEIKPVYKANSAFAPFLHFLHVLLDVL